MQKRPSSCEGAWQASPLLQNTLLTVALALLATLAGVMAGGSWAWLALLAAAVVGLGHWAERHDWLVRAEGDAPPGRRLRDAAVVVVSAVFAVAYVAPHRRQQARRSPSRTTSPRCWPPSASAPVPDSPRGWAWPPFPRRAGMD